MKAEEMVGAELGNGYEREAGRSSFEQHVGSPAAGRGRPEAQPESVPGEGRPAAPRVEPRRTPVPRPPAPAAPKPEPVPATAETEPEIDVRKLMREMAEEDEPQLQTDKSFFG